ncbi:LysE family translocator [Pseudophaeobacter sp.]|uniref:LysE family translocator n=1 Tax=Pseudophaeobacter sp. TaxID=1971739 RepID=UPI003296F673
MTWTEVTSFVIIASLLVMSPGPNGFLIAKTVPTSGRNAGFANVAGFVTAFFLHGSLSIIGISIILTSSATAFSVVKFLGAGYMFWIGCKALFSAFKGNEPAEETHPVKGRQTLTRAYVEGFLTNALNPKVSLFYLAAFPQFIPVGETSVAMSFLLVLLHSAVAALWFVAMILVFSSLSTITKNKSFQRWIKGLTGLVFIGFGLKLATYRPII